MDYEVDDGEANREKAMLYYAQNGIPKLLEELLNNMFYDNPDDIFAYLSNNLRILSKPPVFSRVVAQSILTVQSGSALKIKVYYIRNDKEKLTAQVSFSFSALTSFYEIHVQSVMVWINENINLAFQGLNFNKQTELDNSILDIVSTLPLSFLFDTKSTSTINEPTKKLEARKSKTGDIMSNVVEENLNQITGDSIAKSIITWSLSSAIFAANAALNNRPLFSHFRRLSHQNNDKDSDFLITIFHNSKAAPSRLTLCSEVGVIVHQTEGVKPMISLVQTLYETTEKILLSKIGTHKVLMSEKGAFLATHYERLEQILEFIQDMISSSDILSEGNLGYFISCDTNDVYDSDKGKYEIVKGVTKSNDDMVEMYIDLMKRFPQLSVLIDPFHQSDINSWTRLSSRQEECSLPCNVFVSLMVPNVIHYVETQTLLCTGFLLQPQIVGTISQFVSLQKLLKTLNVTMIMDLSELDVIDTQLIDMGIGCQVPIIKLGGAVRGERATLLNRILEIDLEMEQYDEEVDDSDLASNSTSIIQVK